MMAFLNLLFAAKQVSSSKVEGWPSMTRRQFISVSLAEVALPWVPSESVPQVKSLVEGFPLLKTPQHFYLSIDGHTGKRLYSNKDTGECRFFFKGDVVPIDWQLGRLVPFHHSKETKKKSAKRKAILRN